MKTLRHLSAALVLTFVLAFSAIADDGHMNTPTVIQPPPPTTSSSTDGQMDTPAATSTDGHMNTPTVTGSDSSIYADVEYGVTEAMLSLIGSILSL